MYYVYVLRSKKDQRLYTGVTGDLKKRFLQHQRGEVKATQHLRPLELLYDEACRKKLDATAREYALKTDYGRAYLKRRLSHDLEDASAHIAPATLRPTGAMGGGLPGFDR